MKCYINFFDKSNRQKEIRIRIAKRESKRSDERQADRQTDRQTERKKVKKAGWVVTVISQGKKINEK